jgi:hypothetical protein
LRLQPRLIGGALRHVPVLHPSASAGTDDGRTIDWRYTAASPIRETMASPLTRLPAPSFSGGENDGLFEDEE